MPSYSVAFIGTGADPENPDSSGFAMAYAHANGYRRLENCELTACADIVPENAAAFADRFDIPESHAFEDFRVMLEDVDPDIISVCVPPALHADIVVEAAYEGDLDAIHCEKPMDLTWGGAKQMTTVCQRQGVQLTFNHQRRFLPTWVRAREVVDSGEIGDVQRIEMAPPNVFDWGTHTIDFANQILGDVSPLWVMGEIDYREEQLFFGAHNENQAFGCWEYENGVHGMISTGPGSSFVPSFIRVKGNEGILDIEPEDDADLRWRQYGDEDWSRRTIDDTAGPGAISLGIQDVVESLETGRRSELDAWNALNATEIIFGIWESARRRARVDFPLEIDDNPLESMVETGALTPAATND
ncbi:Gfo/Idh/MocA family protein [Halomontanus rarus]|uniref:Gfo/Idh/MocA family protein n=1 Tax=Halomontanus rarus TaxID=3034020 RepID=UPI0023E8D71D|nr:Gfo/Idh/MocA family oxidoreductase [Halovivax sp. TS33]